MKTLTYIAPTKRRKMTKQRRTAIFLARNGICFYCHVQIIPETERWIIEHPEPLNLGGSDRDEDLWPAHQRCGIEKTKADIARIAKRNTAIDRGYAGKKPSRGFRKPVGVVFDWKRGRYVRPSP